VSNMSLMICAGVVWSVWLMSSLRFIVFNSVAR
jgi:hypothetical protein